MADLSLFHTVDEDGNSIERSRPDTKSWEDVQECIEHNQGGNCAGVCKVIRMALDGDQWDWYEQYKAWRTKCEEIERYNAGRTEDDEGNLPPVKPLPDMPERPTVDLDKVRALRVKHLRSVANTALEPLTSTYPWREILTWDVQALGASGVSPNTTLIDRIASQRSAISNDDLKTRISEKDNSWQEIAGDVIGKRQDIEDQFWSAATLEELLSIRIELTLPA